MKFKEGDLIKSMDSDRIYKFIRHVESKVDGQSFIVFSIDSEEEFPTHTRFELATSEEIAKTLAAKMGGVMKFKEGDILHYPNNDDFVYEIVKMDPFIIKVVGDEHTYCEYKASQFRLATNKEISKAVVKRLIS